MPLTAFLNRRGICTDSRLAQGQPAREQKLDLPSVSARSGTVSDRS